jgi:predicted dinucleotide-binding enzyme
MKIAIIGSGMIGSTVARIFVAAGHESCGDAGPDVGAIQGLQERRPETWLVQARAGAVTGGPLAGNAK